MSLRPPILTGPRDLKRAALLNPFVKSGSLPSLVRPLRRTFPIVCSFVLLPLAAHADEGPIPIRNLFPLYLGVQTLEPRSASIQPGWQFNGAYSLEVDSQDNGHWQAVMDMETFYFEPNYTQRIGDGWFASYRVPIYYAYGGFMDEFIIRYHKFLGLPVGPRPSRPHDKYEYRIVHDGRAIMQSTGRGPGLGDLGVSLLRQFPAHGRDRVSGELALQLPTGNFTKGYGGQSAQVAGILHWDHGTRRFGSYSSLGYFVPGKYGNQHSIDLKNFWSYSVSGEWFHSPKTSVVIQLLRFSNPFPSTGLSSIDEDPLQLAIIYRRRFRRKTWSFGFTENLTAGQSPDIDFIAILNRR